MERSIVVVGSANIDFSMTMDRLPKFDETVAAHEFAQAFGGKGANQAVAAARAGGSVSFIACTGDDALSYSMVRSYETSGVRTNAVVHETGVATGSALIMVGEAGHYYLSVAPGANAHLTPGRVREHQALIQDAGMVLLQYEIAESTIAFVLELCRSHNVPAIWNIAPANAFGSALLALTDTVVVNEPEAALVSGIEVTDRSSAERAAREICSRGVRTAIVTLGPAGSVAVERRSDGSENALFAEAFPVHSVDSTAAGDTFCGCLAVALTEGKSLEDALRFASAAAALCVQTLGAQSSAPFRAAIDELLERPR